MRNRNRYTVEVRTTSTDWKVLDTVESEDAANDLVEFQKAEDRLDGVEFDYRVVTALEAL